MAALYQPPRQAVLPPTTVAVPSSVESSASPADDQLSEDELAHYDASASNEPVTSESAGSASQTPTGSASPESEPQTPVVPLSESTRISIAEIGYDTSVRQMTTVNGVVDPPDYESTYRITDRGSLPGSSAENTVYLACHSAASIDAPCNAVYQYATVGQEIVLTTETGTLTYRISSVETLSKDGEFENSPKVREVAPGRLVLVTCLQIGYGHSSEENFVVFADLV